MEVTTLNCRNLDVPRRWNSKVPLPLSNAGYGNRNSLRKCVSWGRAVTDANSAPWADQCYCH